MMTWFRKAIFPWRRRSAWAPVEQMERAALSKFRAALELDLRVARPLWGQRRLALPFSRARDAAVPWYLILGESNAGKTTLIRQSGLDPSRLELRRPVDRDERDCACEIWTSQAACLIEVAGLLLDSDSASDRSALLFDRLWRARRGRPPAGVVVVVSLKELSGGGAGKVAALGQRLRQRLEALRDRCEAVIPVYFVWTYADRIPGFTEFWQRCEASVLSAPWGTRLRPPNAQISLRGEVLEAATKAQLRALEGNAYAALPRRLSAAQSAAERRAILNFPPSLGSLCEPMAKLVRYATTSSAEAALGPVRGVYLAGGTGKERYFTAQLFESAIVNDHAASQRTPAFKRRQVRRELSALVALSGGLVFATVPAALGYIDNVDLIETTCLEARQHHAPTPTAPDVAMTSAPPAEPARLDVSLGALTRLERAAEGFSVRHWWGPHTARLLLGPASTLYLERLRDVVNSTVREQLLASLRSASDVAQLDADSFEAAYTDLRLYLMLGRGGRIEPDWAGPELARLWARARQRGAYRGDGDLEAHAARFARALADRPEWLWPEDPALVARVRGLLAAVPLEEVAYARLARMVQSIGAVRAADIFSGAAGRHVHGSAVVAGLYTPRGWTEINPSLSGSVPLGIDPWVLRDHSEPLALSTERLHAVYFDRYTRAWLDFLVGLDVVAPTTLEQAVDQLHQLAEVEGPLVRLFRHLSDNAELRWASPTESPVQVVTQLGSGAGAAVLERPVALELSTRFRAFAEFRAGSPSNPESARNAPLSQYMEQLRGLELGLRQIAGGELPLDLEFTDRAARAQLTAERLLSQLPDSHQLSLARLLLDPIRGARALLQRKDAAEMTERWQREVLPQIEQLRRLYPFQPRASAEASLEQFSKLLHPEGGEFWKFFQAHLAARTVQLNDRFENGTNTNAEPLSSASLRCLQAAKAIGDALYGAGPAPSFSFAVKLSPPHDGSSIALEVDGQRIAQADEPEHWQSLEWPGKGGNVGAAIAVTRQRISNEVRREGELGLIRLMRDGQVRPVSVGSALLEARWQLERSGPPVIVQIRPATDTHPFVPRLFEQFACPRQLLERRAGGAG